MIYLIWMVKYVRTDSPLSASCESCDIVTAQGKEGQKASEIGAAFAN